MIQNIAPLMLRLNVLSLLLRASSRVAMSYSILIRTLSYCALFVTPQLYAQEYSSDGNRWFEIELSVFAIDMPPGQIEEQPQVLASSLEYLANLQTLREASSSFQIDFDSESGAEEFSPTAARADIPASASPGPMRIGPGTTAFRIDDFDRDPFIALDKRFWGFSDDLQRIQSAPDFDLLWHATWRQTMQSSQQTPALLVVGGQRYGLHNELEGSMRFSDNNGKLKMDINLWFSFFESSNQTNGLNLNLPEQALLSSANQTQVSPSNLAASNDWAATEIWQIKNTRDLGINTFYYLDNPAFGVVVQARPYVLPSSTLLDTDEDF